MRIAMEFMYLTEEFIAKCRVKPDRSRVVEFVDPNEKGFQRLLTMFELKVRLLPLASADLLNSYCISSMTISCF